MTKQLRILGTRGIPGRHGGFETFAEDLSLYLANRDWQVTVYCQEDGDAPLRESMWCGIRLVHISVNVPGALGTIIFDWKCTMHAAGETGRILVLGYNTALFGAVFRMKGLSHSLNMDGMEWKRQKYNWPERAWFYLNERLGVLVANHLIADHPVIANRHIGQSSSERVTMIPYGSRVVETATETSLVPYGLSPGAYALVVARPEPENSTLQIVQAFSRSRRGCKLVVLGNYRQNVAYERAVVDAASDEVVFPGAVYDRAKIDALRFHARVYVHGHTVGGTNPALVEALGAGAPVLAHDNPFNRWVASDAGQYFSSVDDCGQRLTYLLSDSGAAVLAKMRAAARDRHRAAFTLPVTLGEYEATLLRV
ncbi:MAG: DUF1972 domain-containing protein [Gemmatimonas sp.]